jgi:DNA-binding MarR family transcriptional regulator
MSTPPAAQPRANPPLQVERQDYVILSEFRYLLHRFLAFSQTAAQQAGLTARQHQALLAIKGFPGGDPVTVHDLAERLCIQHHSAVELIDRLHEGGLVVRHHDPADRRRVRLQLTEVAEAHLAGLSAIHLEELRRLRPALLSILAVIGERVG